jgi:predicted dehydrogenase
VVLVCTPPAEHRAPAVAAFERGLDVYLEKPVARSLDDAAAIARAAAGRICAVGYQWRAIEVLERVRAELADRPPALISGRGNGLIVGGRSWFSDTSLGGGILSEAASHMIDLELMLGGRVREVRAVSAAAGLGAAPPTLDDVVTLILSFVNGALGVVEVAWTGDGVPARYVLDVVAADAALGLSLEPEVRLTGYANGRTIDAYPLVDHEERSLAAFLRSAREGDESGVCCSLEDGVETLAVVLACERALRLAGEPVLV